MKGRDRVRGAVFDATLAVQNDDQRARVLVRPGDMVNTLGAGDIWKTAEELCLLLEEKRK